MLYYKNNALSHYGLKGMKWGTRRWQYADGRFNDDGKARYFGQNSSHRPNSVRELQGDPPKKESKSTIKASSEKKEFDKEKAKKIAKNVAIGAAVVGGAVLVTYGGYKVHEAGGFSQISKNITAKMRETKLENLKTKQEYKVNIASIKSEGKARLSEIRENTKTELAGIHEKGKNERRNLKGQLKETVQDITERKPGEYSKDQEKYADYYRKHSEYYQPIEFTSNGRKYMTFKNDSDGSEPPMLIDLGSVSSNKSAVSSRKGPENHIDFKNAKINIKSPAQIISEYKKEHPATKLSDSEIVKSYSGEGKSQSRTKSGSKIPKLTLNPETAKAGAAMVSDLAKTTSNLVELGKMNQQQQAQAKRGAKAVDDYTKGLSNKNKKKK